MFGKFKAYLPLVTSGGLLFIEIFFLLSSLLFFTYHLYYARKVIPGVTLGGQIYLGGKTTGEAITMLKDKEPFLADTSLEIVLPENEVGPLKRITLPLTELGVIWQLDKTVKDAYRVGRSGYFPQDLIAEVQAFGRGKNISLNYVLDEDKLAGALGKLSEELGQPPADAAFIFKEGRLVLTPERSGFALVDEEVRKAIQRAASLQRTTPLTLASVHPQLKGEELLMLKPQLEELLKQPLKLTAAEHTFALVPEQILSFLVFTKEGGGRVVIKADRDKVAAYLKEIGTQIDASARGQIIEIVDGRVAKFVPQSEGVELDRFAAINLLSGRLTESSVSSELSLPLKKLPPPPVEENAYGIHELLGEGKTNFAGSIPGRIHNITLAAGRLNGVLIPPGQLFSFNESVGEVSARTGYDAAYIISEGRTVLGTGGGLCQVSSTLFRAVLNAGLPIIKRTAHAYRVHYYEPPVGFDATVYAPSVDLQFRNDTPAYILVTAEIKGLDLYFRLYGSSDGRQVEINGPYIASETPPPAPLFQEDATLPKGVKRQVDWEAWGAHVSFTRLVRRNGEVLENDSFQSHYSPWRAIYLVGTKEG